ncbi:phosphonate ABC transporter, permease protein PhnE [Aeromicrobium sp. CTD01-1L150]|uniref:phosphonate ABC transporter, permease protein PhnE n=1 Tax=Aeromicrobium sp. CTD01-1L150 TaxID=3341830 RepID=UPI0035C10695
MSVWVVMLGLLAAAAWSIVDLGVSPATILLGVENAVNFVSRVFPLDFPPVSEVVALTVETLAIVTVATAFAVLVSTPIAIFAAATTTTGRMARGSARVVIVTARAIPDLVFAIILFRVFSLGALPGILALGLHSIGMIAKMYADAIEEVDAGPIEAVTVAGGSRWQWIVSAVIPQVMLQMIATALHRFDINLRTSVLLGYVGVGGIGLAIRDALSTMNYARGMALAVIVIGLCILVEMLSGAVRARLLGRPRERRGLRGLADRFSGGWVDSPMATHEAQRTRRGAVRISPPWNGERIRRYLGIAATLLVLAAATLANDVDPARIGRDLLNLPQTLGLFWPPSDDGLLGTFLEALLVTVQIGLAATLLGLLLAIPMGSLAARNVAPNASVAAGFRTLIVVVRGIPELILAIVFIVITGLGPVPGVLALAIGSVGLLGKLVADSLEETDVRVQDAVRASGGSRVQVYVAATVRQVLPALVAHVLYQLDVNIRSATLLGIVGAGGIGFYLMNAARVQQFEAVTLLVLLILAVVLALEVIAVWTRRVVR